MTRFVTVTMPLEEAEAVHRLGRTVLHSTHPVACQLLDQALPSTEEFKRGCAGFERLEAAILAAEARTAVLTDN